MAVDLLLGLQWGDEGKGKIVDVIEKGYLLSTKVLRYAKVVVAN